MRKSLFAIIAIVVLVAGIACRSAESTTTPAPITQQSPAIDDSPKISIPPANLTALEKDALGQKESLVNQFLDSIKQGKGTDAVTCAGAIGVSFFGLKDWKIFINEYNPEAGSLIVKITSTNQSGQLIAAKWKFVFIPRSATDDHLCIGLIQEVK